MDGAFFEWQDYKTLFESSDRFIVVGRRGTGKSALVYQLGKIWGSRKFPIIEVAPTEEQLIGLRPLARMFGDTVSRIRVGVKIAWKYALLMEIALSLSNDYKAKRSIEGDRLLMDRIVTWKSLGGDCITRLRGQLKMFSKAFESEEERIAELSAFLDITKVGASVMGALNTIERTFIILIDRLDEGYEPDAVGTGLIDGILYGTDEVRSSLLDKVKVAVFIRDNMLRAIEAEDRDFTRNLESQVLRLHWDPQELFYLVAKRVRFVFGVAKESDIKVWNSITSNELHGREGFKKCLRLTLYRPRDVIALLNAAFYQAQRQQRNTLIEADFEASAKQISSTRYSDLGKEYETVLPGVKTLTSAFSGCEAKLSWREAANIVSGAMGAAGLNLAEVQHFEILNSPDEAIKALYGIGFVGMFDRQHGSFVFSHDGKRPIKQFGESDILMIHPCYWSALNIQGFEIDQDGAEEIFDEYEITIESHSGEQRRRLLGQLISELNTIPDGSSGAQQFEEWCKRAVEICFARELTNVQLRPNANASQRRDIVATNQGGGVWKRVLQDYGTRQVIFEVKNFERIGVEEFRQAYGYLGKEYGRLAIIICRDPESGLRRGAELDAFREFYGKDALIIKFPASQFVTILSKLRNPEKFDAGELALERLLDSYVRLYASGQSDVRRSDSTSRRKKRR
ncbi:ATP-binding protein [Stenotrophomonas sp. SORGH_AS_0321]|uniref:P-loop ATPase, Sll1717 family n=1 Tax=Stenotrophomonas sp. SORGH_AS_0321 TaxID=3041787 RepID=UPI00286BC412|nr:ATP-binding protein [Stenotrophomonas sp. SORGH_AS_0321]